jgi:hypothetical protein
MDILTPITLFHLSFQDFLVNPELQRKHKFWIHANENHWTLGLHCIRLLGSGSLKEDVCGVADLGTLQSEVAKSTVQSRLPEVVVYASCYWIRHIVSSRKQVKDDSAVLRFLQKHMLPWMEALSWLRKTSDIIHNIAALRSVVDVSHTPIHTRNATYLLIDEVMNGYE